MIKYCTVFLGAFLLLACTGSKSKNDPAHPVPVVVTPGPDGPGLGGSEPKEGKGAEVCKMLESDGLIARTATDSPSKDLVKVSISESDNVKFTVECPGTLLKQ